MNKKYSFAALAAVVLVTGGCLGETLPYQYLSFQAYPGAVVVSWMKHGPQNVKLDVAVPLEYEIKRPEYSINIRLPDEVNGKIPLISVIGTKNGVLEIFGPHIIALPSNKRYPRYHYLFSPPPSAGIRLLKFSVHDEDGALMKQEEIPFQVKTGGSYVSYEGI